MGNFDNGFICRCFKLEDIGNIDNYSKAYGQTRDRLGTLLYKTEGRLIPWNDFKYILLFNSIKG